MTQSATRERAGSAAVVRRILILLGITAVVLGAAALWRPNLVTSTLTSPLAIAFIVGAVLVAVGVRYAVTRWTGSPLAGRLAQVVPLGLVAWFFLVPTLFPTTVDEPPPMAGSAAVAPGEQPAGARAAQTRAAFRPLDHDVSGEAVLLSSGARRVVRFENFTVEPGPDYLVYLVPTAGAATPGDGVLLGPLKASRGNQNYEVPADARTSGPLTVLIWCRAFQVPIAHATLTAA